MLNHITTMKPEPRNKNIDAKTAHTFDFTTFTDYHHDTEISITKCIRTNHSQSIRLSSDKVSIIPVHAKHKQSLVFVCKEL